MKISQGLRKRTTKFEKSIKAVEVLLKELRIVVLFYRNSSKIWRRKILKETKTFNKQDRKLNKWISKMRGWERGYEMQDKSSQNWVHRCWILVLINNWKHLT